MKKSSNFMDFFWPTQVDSLLLIQQTSLEFYNLEWPLVFQEKHFPARFIKSTVLILGPEYFLLNFPSTTDHEQTTAPAHHLEFPQPSQRSISPCSNPPPRIDYTEWEAG
jgi:hypothetical protein